MPDSARQWKRTLGSASQSYQRNRNPGKGKPISTECVAALGKSLFFTCPILVDYNGPSQADFYFA
jgi:hypothetical protein